MATTYDPLQDALKDAQAPQQPGIFNMAAAPAPAATAAPAPAPSPTPAHAGPGIVGAQSQQLGAPTPWNVSDDQTVEGRINRIINSGSPFMQQARTRAAETAASRGLVNSSMAVTAGESAALDAALPIAQADAATVAKAAGYNADQTNQFAVKNTDSENQFKLQDKQVQGEKDLALINRETQVQLSTLDAQNRATATALQAQNDRILQTNAQAGQAFQTAMSAVNNIQNNNQMDANTKSQAITQVWHDLQMQLRVMGSVAGLDLTSQLNFANYPGFDGSGNFVGFAAPAAAGSAPGQPGADNGQPTGAARCTPPSRVVQLFDGPRGRLADPRWSPSPASSCARWCRRSSRCCSCTTTSSRCTRT
jgi:hypothetical protein